MGLGQPPPAPTCTQRGGDGAGRTSCESGAGGTSSGANSCQHGEWDRHMEQKQLITAARACLCQPGLLGTQGSSAVRFPSLEGDLSPRAAGLQKSCSLLPAPRAQSPGSALPSCCMTSPTSCVRMWPCTSTRTSCSCPSLRRPAGAASAPSRSTSRPHSVPRGSICCARVTPCRPTTSSAPGLSRC